jgi:hypothetical protein
MEFDQQIWVGCIYAPGIGAQAHPTEFGSEFRIANASPLLSDGVRHGW